MEHSWLKSYPKDIDWSKPIIAQPLYHILDKTIERFPNNVAIDFLGKKYIYKELEGLIHSAAEGLRKLGVAKGTKVGLFLPNCPQFIIAYYAILKAGGVVVNFSPLYSVPELKHQLEDSETEIMITLNLAALYPKIKQLLGKGKLQKIVVGNMSEILPFPKNHLFECFRRSEIAKIKYDEKHISWQKLCENDAIVEVPKIEPAKDIAVLQYTGGTTGIPKGAALTHANVYANAVQAGRWCNNLEDGNEKMMAVLPFFHVFAMTVVMNLSISRGFEILMHPRFEIKFVLKDIDLKKPTILPGVPTMYAAINNHPKVGDYDLSSIKTCISGGAGLPLNVKHKFEALTGGKLVEGYGLTETSPVACCNPLLGINKEGSIGLPLPSTEILIEDMENSGKFLPIGEKGEICIKGPQVMQGYWQNEEATASTLQDDIFRTGDVGYIDEDGYVFLVDRIKELILAGGFNIYPRNVEDVIYQHDAVAEVAVIGIPDAYRGETVKAFIALKAGESLDADDIKEFLKDKLGRHEIPTHVEFRDELPKTMIGKISKKDL